MVYTSMIPPTATLYADVCIYDGGGTVHNAYVNNLGNGTFTAQTVSSGTNPTYNWKVNGSLVLSGQSDLSASDFITYIIIFTQVLNPAKEISRAVSSIQRGIASAERIFEVIDSKTQIQSPPNPAPLSSFSDKISFQNVSFSYGEHPVLKDINFEIEQGDVVGIIGVNNNE